MPSVDIAVDAAASSADPFQSALDASSPALPLTIHTDPYSGRSYRASRPLPENSTLLAVPSPYSYNIYKRFRAEVCAECWRYERGRRGFLTRRDALGYDGAQDKGKGPGAGLYFCDAVCQASWIAREGLDAIWVLTQIERARRTKPDDPHSADTAAPPITQETVDAAWAEVRDREARGGRKELRKWGAAVVLDDYETDMARYVALALLRLHHERHPRTPAAHAPSEATGAGTEGTWAAFAALQNNELALLRPLPALLPHHIRIYQALKARLLLPLSSPPTNGDGEVDLSAELSVENVRTALGVDAGNSFGIWETPVGAESECFGFGVYPLASLFNHSKSAYP